MDASEQERRESLQAKKHDVVRREIWNAAIDLFHEHSFDNVTIEQIANRAGVSYRTFFRYFSSKDDVMASTVKSYGEALIKAIAAEKSEVSQLDAARSAIKKVLAQDSTATERLLQIALRSKAARMAQYLEVPILELEIAHAFALREGDLIPAGDMSRAGIRYRVLANLALSATGICTEAWVLQRNQPIAEIVDKVFESILDICGKPIGAVLRSCEPHAPNVKSKSK